MRSKRVPRFGFAELCHSLPIARRRADGPRSQDKGWKYLTPSDLKRFKNLLFAARTIVEGLYAGRHKSPYRGSAPEFVDYREYHPGDELRSIDWKAFARTDRYVVKLFEKETDMNGYILLDRSASMGFGGRATQRLLPKAGLSKLEYGCYLAAALSYLLVKQGDKVGLTLFDRDISRHVPPGGSFAQLYNVLNALEHCEPGRTTAISDVLRKTSGLYKRKGLIILISDLLDDPEEIFRALSMFSHRGFEIILFHVFHQYEYRLPPVASVNFIDAENGGMMTCLPADIETAYDAEIEEYLSTISSLARARDIDYNFIDTATPYSAVLEKYLLMRRRL